MNKIILISFGFLFTYFAHAEKEWILVHPPFDQYEDNMGIYCFDSSKCISFTSSHYLRFINKSSDGGKTWELYNDFDFSNSSDPIDRPYRTFVYDSNQFYTLYYDGIAIDKSVNGGETFHRHHFGQLSTIKDYGLDNLIMFSKDKGVALSLGWLLLTEDNWSSYEVVDIPEEYYLDESMFYIDSNNIAFLNIVLDNDTSEYFNQFVKYNTISKEWSLYSNIEKRDNKSEYPILRGLSIVNDTIIYACGFQDTGVADLAYDLVWKSTDKGKTWNRILKQSKDLGFGLMFISFRNEKHGIAVGNWGNIIETTDGGESWFQYPRNTNMSSITSEITWAGSSAIYTSDGKGIYRLETKSEVEELSSNEKFKVYQSGHNLEIAINDDTYASYEFRLYNSSGQLLQTNRLKSNFGFLFETVELVLLNSGVYYYTLTQNSNNQFKGKLIIVN